MKPQATIGKTLYQRSLHSMNIAIEAVIANRVRSMLTALGIIFGVAAVIAMMAIGTGAKKVILDQIKLVGVNNIVVTPLEEVAGQGESGDEESGQKMQKSFSPGLTLEDAESIADIIPTVFRVSPEVTYDTYIIKSGKRSPAKLVGVTNDFFQVYNLNLVSGQFFQEKHIEGGSPVCVIGPTVKSRFFSQEDPLGKTIKCGGIWLTVIGVLENRAFKVDNSEDLGISDYSDHIYAPIQTVLLRYKDRAYVNEAALREGSSSSVFMFDGGGFATFSGSSSSSGESIHQLDKIVVQVSESKYLDVTTKALTTMLTRRHQKVDDFQVSVPELLLKQEQRTNDIFNIVLGVIAGISLLVGGIGIMNIMLASVMERTKEIGIRRATGATRRDVIFQFLSEATIISLSGGVIGIVLGIIFAMIITRTTGILTIITPLSIIVSFGVSAFIGIMFGYMPAKRAAEQDPVESLRYE